MLRFTGTHEAALRRRLLGLALGAAVGLTSLACSGGDSRTAPLTGVAPRGVASVTLSQDTATLVPGATLSLTAVVKDAAGTTVQPTLTWSSSDPSVASVAAGIVTGVSPGFATIQVRVDSAVGVVHVTVNAGGVVGAAGGVVSSRGAVLTLAIPAGALSVATALSVTAAAAPTADARLVQGSAFDIEPSGTAFLRPAAVTVTYDPANIPGQAPPSGLAIYLDSAGAWWPLPGGSTVNTTARTVTGVTSHLSTYALLASPASAPATAATIDVSPGAVTLATGSTAQLIAVTRDAQGQVITGRPVAWASSDTHIATVTNGQVTGLAAGSAVVSATSDGHTATAAVTVQSQPAPTTATLTVASNMSSQWTISPGAVRGSGTAGSFTVTPGTTGTLFTLSPDPEPGYTATVSNSDGGGASVMLSGGQTKSFTITYAPTLQQPTVSVAASPAAITAGQSTTVSWTATNATACSGSWSGATTLPTSGNQAVSPANTTTYTVTCTGPGGTSSNSRTVTVTSAPVGTLTINVGGLPAGVHGDLTISGPLSFSETISTTVTLPNLATGNYTIVARAVTSGSITYQPSPATQTQTVTSGASASATVTYTAPSPPIVTMSASATSVAVGQPVTLAWNASNATSCQASWSTGTLRPSGSQLMLPTTTTTYTVTCVGPGGSATASKLVAVTVALAPTVSSISPDPYVGSSAKTVVTLTGTNFTNTTRVFFAVPRYNTSYEVDPSDIHVLSPTQLTAGVTLGSTAATWNASVMSAGGTSAPLPFRVVYDDYPAADKYAGFDPNLGVPDQWSFYKMNCTSFVAWRLTQDGVTNFNDYYLGQHWGYAQNWDVAARAAGLTVDHTPAIGAVAQFKSIDHVAYVAAVYTDGTLLIEEYNYHLNGTYDTRTVPASSVTNFIHVH